MQSLQIAVSEIWVTLIFIVIMYLFRGELEQKKITKLLMLTCITRLLSDAVSWAFDGLPGIFWGLITRSSNYITFVTNDLISLLFSVFLWSLIKREGEKPGLVLKAYWLLEGITIALLTLNLHFGWFYAFDSSNLYSRGDYYRLTHIAPIAAIFVVAWMLLWYHDRFSKNINVMGWTYFFFMAVATAYELTNFGLSFQTYAQTFSALVAFFVGEIELRENLLATHKKLEQANEELKEEEQKVKAALEAERKMDAELREQQEQLSLALAAAQQANRAKTMFLNNMSHDIRTPMNALLGYTELLKHELTSKKQLEYQEKMEQSGKLLLSILNNVLDMARIESGKAELDENYSRVGDILSEICDVFDVEAQRKGLTLVREAKVQHEHIVCDVTKIKEIFTNLVSNAVKYTPRGGTITLRSEELEQTAEGYVTIRTEVIDTGIGMSAEYLPTLFEVFSRERNTTMGKVAGTGLGMAIVKKLVDMMGGTIEVESELGKGSRFIVTLRHKIADSAYYTRPEKQEHAAVNEESLQGKQILMAEDNDLNAEIAMFVLEQLGLVVERVADGVQCVDKLMQQPAGTYDAILMDIQMPNMDGYKATETIRRLADKEKAEIPIIAMTANAFEEDKRNALKAGMNAHIAKPVNVQQLKEVLENILR